ncbi:uncharacterized protein LOC117557196 [Gymnodraco acuticeps]|uniref:Uncharacterized protein LOC117557196 n=1 Tax=Gymnodraco acuticeps TaxID=8218 RepID=A0A6P8VTY7_GYMAC|nr:uncharacterized protein LOC117557196 [Gymnodraco acuticeps]
METSQENAGMKESFGGKDVADIIAGCESNGGILKKLSSIKEDEEGSGSEGERSPLPRVTPLGRLGRGLRSPLPSPMRSPLRSPMMPSRTFRAVGDRPTSLQIPIVSYNIPPPPNFSPRFVYGIETENQSGSAQMFDYSPRSPQSLLTSPDSGPHEEADTMQTIAKLKHEMSVLSGQVTSVSQELQEMTRLLKPLFHNPSMLLMRVTPPTQHAPVDNHHHTPSCIPRLRVSRFSQSPSSYPDVIPSSASSTKDNHRCEEDRRSKPRMLHPTHCMTNISAWELRCKYYRLFADLIIK